MKPISPKLQADLEQAAALRAEGLSWDAVAATLGRPAGTCSRWPSQYATEWKRLLARAHRRAEAEATAEARTALRRLLRHKEDKLKLDAAAQLMRAAPKRSRIGKPRDDGGDPELAAIICEAREYTDEELDAAVLRARAELGDLASRAESAAESQ